MTSVTELSQDLRDTPRLDRRMAVPLRSSADERRMSTHAELSALVECGHYGPWHVQGVGDWDVRRG